MLEKIKEIYFKYKEIINYLIVGGIITVLNYVLYFIFTRLFSIDEIVSNGLAWFFSVLFAYITNKIFVFGSKKKDKKTVLKEISSFFTLRIVSGILCDVGTFALMVKVLGINDLISKIITQIMVIILNYIFSKFIVFKKKRQD